MSSLYLGLENLSVGSSTSDVTFEKWKPNTLYDQNKYVVYNYKIYKSLIKHTSSTVFDNDLTLGNWELYVGGSSTTDIDLWRTGEKYINGDVVKDKNENIYRCVVPHVSNNFESEKDVNWIIELETYFSVNSKSQYDKMVEGGIITQDNRHLYVIQENIGGIIKSYKDIDDVYAETYNYKSEPIQDGETNLFVFKSTDVSGKLNIKDDNITTQGSYKITGYIDIGDNNYTDKDQTNSLIFRLHIITMFYDENKTKISGIETMEYPEHVEIKIPNGAKYIRTVYCVCDEMLLYIVKRPSVNPWFSKNLDDDILLPDLELSEDYKDKTLLYVDKLGFVADGKTDNSQALLNLEAMIERNSKWNSDKVFTIVFGSGKYVFKHTHMDFLSRKHVPKNAVFGLNIQGQGASTIIQYIPDDPNGIDGDEHFFIRNNNKYANITFSNFRFVGHWYRKASFCRITATPYPQHIVFDKVMFDSSHTVVELKGCDCGSEIMFDHCKFGGKIDNVLKAVRPGISHQFLNYWFINPDFQCTGGSLVNLELGGNVNIIGGNLIHKNTGGGYNEGGTFFKLGYDWIADGRKTEPQLGICRFLCQGVRFETHVNRNSRIMESYWDKNGSIMFINCDDGAKNGSGISIEDIEIPITDKFGNQLSKDGRIVKDVDGKEILKDVPVATQKMPSISDEYKAIYDDLIKSKGEVTDEMVLKEFKFHILNGTPSMKFENCILHGRHEYDFSNNNEQRINKSQNMVIYDGNIVSGKQNLTKPWDFIIIKEKANNSDGFLYSSKILPAIKFINLTKDWEQYDGCCYGNRELVGEISQKKYINLKDVYGTYPNNNTAYTIIQKGKLLTGLLLYAPENYTDSEIANNIYIKLVQTVGKYPHAVTTDYKTIFSIGTDGKLNIYGEDEQTLTTEENKANKGLAYNISFKKPLLVPESADEYGIQFYKNGTGDGVDMKDKMIAMLEFI